MRTAGGAAVVTHKTPFPSPALFLPNLETLASGGAGENSGEMANAKVQIGLNVW